MDIIITSRQCDKGSETARYLVRREHWTNGTDLAFCGHHMAEVDTHGMAATDIAPLPESPARKAEAESEPTKSSEEFELNPNREISETDLLYLWSFDPKCSDARAKLRKLWQARNNGEDPPEFQH